MRQGDTQNISTNLGDNTIQKQVPEPGRNTIFVPSLTIQDDLGFADLTSVTSYFWRQDSRVKDGTAFNSAPAMAQRSHRHPASGCQDRRSTNMATVRMTAQAISRTATNSSGERCRSPTFPEMKEELQSSTNKNGASLTNIPIPASGGHS